MSRTGIAARPPGTRFRDPGRLDYFFAAARLAGALAAVFAAAGAFAAAFGAAAALAAAAFGAAAPSLRRSPWPPRRGRRGWPSVPRSPSPPWPPGPSRPRSAALAAAVVAGTRRPGAAAFSAGAVLPVGLRGRGRRAGRCTGLRLRGGGPGGERRGAGATLGQLHRAGDDVLEQLAGTERRHGGLLHLDGLAGARVAGGSCGAGPLLEDAEPGDGHAVTRLHRPHDQIDDAFDGQLRRLLVPVQPLGELTDQVGLVHESSQVEAAHTTVSRLGRPR